MKTILTPNQETLARQVAKDLGAAFEAARKAAGESQATVARRLRMHSSTVSAFERGVWVNLKVGNAVRILSAYNISIVPVTPSQTALPLEALS